MRGSTLPFVDGLFSNDESEIVIVGVLAAFFRVGFLVSFVIETTLAWGLERDGDCGFS